MAGTGHEYEVINVGRVVESLRAFGDSVRYPEGRDWFVSPKAIRLATSPTFVVRTAGAEAEEAIANHVADARERGIVLDKLRAGCDLRLFVPEFLERLGPDFRHIADWMASLPRTAPRMVPKLARIDVRAALLHADRWVSAMAKAAATAGEGTVETVLESRPGYVWVELRDEAALAAESAMMHHCVHGYGEALEAGTRIFSLRGTSGGALVTLELVRAAGGTMLARQIKGPNNHVPRQSLRCDVAALLNHLSVPGEVNREAAGMGIVKDSEGRWRMVSEVARRIDVAGMAGYSSGNEIHLVSPVDAERMVGVLVGDPAWLDAPEDRKRILLMDAGDARSHTLAEQRAVARVASGLGLQRVSGFPYLVLTGDGEWKAWFDTCEEWEAGDARFLTRGDAVHVMNESNRDILVTVRPHERKYLRHLEAEVVARERTWSAGEVRRIAAVLDFLRVESLKDPEQALRGTGLHQGPGSAWYRFADAAVEHPYGGDFPDGRPPQWLVAPYRIVLRDARGSLIEAARDADGRVYWIMAMPSCTVGHLREACRLMNGLGIAAAPDYASRSVLTGLRWRDGGKPTGDGEEHALVCLDGTWKVVMSWRELLAELRKVGRRRFRDPLCGESAIHLLPEIGTDPAADLELARHLAGWAARKRKDDLVLYNGLLGGRNDPRESSEGRVTIAAGLLHLMGPRERAACAKAAEHLMRSVIGRTKYPKGAFTPQDKVRDLLILYRAHLPARFLIRAIPWALWVGTLLDGKPDALKVDTRWFDLPEDVRKDYRVAYKLQDAARSSCYRLKSSPEKVLIEEAQDAIEWIRVIEMSKVSYMRREVPEALEILDGIVAERFAGTEWAEVRSLIAAARERHEDVPVAA